MWLLAKSHDQCEIGPVRIADHSIWSCEAALIRISGLPLYNSIWPEILNAREQALLRN